MGKKSGWVGFCFCTYRHTSLWEMCFPFAVRPPVCSSHPETHDRGTTQRPRHGQTPQTPRTPRATEYLPASFYSLYNINSIFKLHMNTEMAPPGGLLHAEGDPHISVTPLSPSRPRPLGHLPSSPHQGNERFSAHLHTLHFP